MNKIIAKGKLVKIEMEVVCFESEEGLSFEFDGNEDSFLERIFRNELEKRKPIGGTYYPKTNSLLNAYNVLNSGRFFDELYDGFDIRRVAATRRINSKGDRRGKISELIITNIKNDGENVSI